jgi:flagellar P-ring protein precursor FlgI
MTRTLTTALVAACLLVGMLPAGATSRIKDLANFEGVRQNHLIGYGLVVGLNGTGDTLNNIPFTKQSLQAMLERLGVNIRGAQIRTGNVAAVMVTANLPPFGTQGTRIDVTVSALGDSKSLQGGTLLVTPLLGADGNVYAVAQGSLAVAGFQAQGDAAKITRGVPTVGRISNGAIIEREIEFALNRLMQLRLALRNADFTTAKRIAAAVNDFLGSPTAEPLDPSTVQLTIPAKFHGNVVALVTEIEQLQIEPDLPAKVVIDERSGVIVMGRDVRVSTVAVAQGNLTVTVAETPQVSQPQPFSRGRTVVVPRTRIGVQEDGKKLALVKEGVSLQQLVDGLNALGIGPLDMIAILQAIKAAGAIQADIDKLAAQTGPAALGALAASGGKPILDFKAKARAAATDFEAVFLNSMFNQMFTGIDGDGPFGGGGGGGVWRSFLSEEYAKSFAKAGGLGLADHVYGALLAQQEARGR